MEFNFLQAMYQCKQLYDIEFTDPDEFAEIGLNAWHLIGNKRTVLNKVVMDVDPNTLTIQLPCKADLIEAVTISPEDWNEVTNKHTDGDYNSLHTEQWIESSKKRKNPLYISGRLANVRKVGDTLYFEKPYKDVNILYKTIILDEDDLPKINEKEVTAIATYVAYITLFKESLKTKNQAAMTLAKELEKKWYIQCDQARTPNEQLTQNEMDSFLNAKYRVLNKNYGKSYKPMLL